MPRRDKMLKAFDDAEKAISEFEKASADLIEAEAAFRKMAETLLVLLVNGWARAKIKPPHDPGT
jgi:hypothetical protein